MRFILGAKQSDHGFLFDWVSHTKATKTVELIDSKGVHHCFRYCNQVPLNDANFQMQINFLEYWETKASGKTDYATLGMDFLSSKLTHCRSTRYIDD